MKYTLFATNVNNQEINIKSDIDTLKFMVSSHPDCARFLASKISSDPGYILSRAPFTIPDLHEMQLTITTDDQEGAENAVRIWAQRSRVAGVRGNRLALVGEFNQVDDDVYTVSVFLSTTVCFNQRRATVNFGASLSDVQDDLAQLYPYVDGTVLASSNLHPGVVLGNQPVVDCTDTGCDCDCEAVYLNELTRSVRSLSAELDTSLDRDDLVSLVASLKLQVEELSEALSND